ncbi:cupin domain-containing protein [Halegenticoccus tardaugens]|uniref:cupin domain-containing protein n=1 Tax=Halegenticoccus tardaugens TaxID=2071624 RepID=UPI0013E918A1|nr:cupin domain-containing protein [Halegenticoccus tardaugens]
MVRPYRADKVPSVYNISKMPVHERSKGVSQRYFRGIDTLIGFTTITSEKTAEPHSHPWEQINFVLEGEGEFRIGDETVSVTEGDVFLVPPNVPHCAEPPEESCTVMFVGPLREDYADLTDYQSEF